MPTGTKRDRIAELLRRRIVAGELPRGQRLRQDDLAEQLGTSITPVREAFRVLESEGLVVSEPHRGVRVATVDPDRVASIYVLRRLSEPYAVERATLRLSELDLRAAERLAAEIAGAAATGEPGDVRRLNRALHFTVYDRCGVPGLAEHIATLWDAFPWDLVLTSPDRLGDSEREHHEILQALRAGDASGAATATAAHIRAGYLALTAAAGGNPSVDPFAPVE